MKNLPYNSNKKNFITMAFTFFALQNKSQPPKKSQIYWVIDEPEGNEASVLVRYFNDQNDVIHQESLALMKMGVIDEEVIFQINQVKSTLQKAWA
jgi:hypothetical protein